MCGEGSNVEEQCGSLEPNTGIIWTVPGLSITEDGT